MLTKYDCTFKITEHLDGYLEGQVLNHFRVIPFNNGFIGF